MGDNGDFPRAYVFITSGPVKNEFPPAYDYTPYWKLEWHLPSLLTPTTSYLSSTTLLWLPGILLNYIFVSTDILATTSLSFFPKILLFFFLVLCLKWMDSDPKYSTILYFFVGIPLVFIFTNTSYIAYLNSFYQETGSFIFLIALIVTMIAFMKFTTYRNLAFSILVVVLLGTSKQSNVYWAAVSLPFIFYVWQVKRKIPFTRTLLFIGSAVTIITLVTVRLSNRDFAALNEYNSLFLGALRFSTNPQKQLRELGVPKAENCIGVSPFLLPKGAKCFEEYKELSFYETVRLFYKEPLIVPREIKFAALQMQDITIDYLAKYSREDPRFPVMDRTGANRRLFAPYENSPFNLWAAIKFRYFPTGYLLFISLLAFFLLFGAGLRHESELGRQISIMGLLTTCATMIDMSLTMIAGGVIELIKHLFLANLLFDISLILFLGLLSMLAIDSMRGYLQKKQ
jgi:hypothetical protein